MEIVREMKERDKQRKDRDKQRGDPKRPPETYDKAAVPDPIEIYDENDDNDNDNDKPEEKLFGCSQACPVSISRTPDGTCGGFSFIPLLFLFLLVIG